MALNTYAKIGDGGTLRMGATGVTALVTNETTSAYTNVAQVLNFTPNMRREKHRVTHMSSALKHQFIAGHVEADVSAQINFTPVANGTNEVNSDTLLAEMQSGVVRAWILQIPQHATNTATLFSVAFLGFMTGFSPVISVDAPNVADCEFAISDSTLVEQG